MHFDHLPEKPRKSLYKYVRNRLNGVCCYCGESHFHLTVDHVKPISKGGTTSLGNLVPACSRCNQSKSHRDVFEWWQKQPFWSEDRARVLIRLLFEEDIAA